MSSKSMDDDDDEPDDLSAMSAQTPLRGGSQHDSQSTELSKQRWPWVLLGVFIGLLVVLLMPGGTPHAVAPAAATALDTSCGAVPSVPPPLVRRRMDGVVRNVLVTGGAGFIASHFALSLIDRKGYNVTVVDDLSRGSMDTILRLQTLAEAAGQPLNFVRLDVNEEHKLVELMRSHGTELVVHFSGNAYVGESMVYPEAYYQNITVRRPQQKAVRTLTHTSSAQLHRLLNHPRACMRAREACTQEARAFARPWHDGLWPRLPHPKNSRKGLTSMRHR